MRNVLLLLLWLLVTVAVTGSCSQPFIFGPRVFAPEYVVRVESDTEWTGTVNGLGVSGFGDRAYPITVGCWWFTKRTTQGLLRSYAMQSNLSSRTPDIPKYSDKATTDAFGSVSGCLK
jgi:hypothetical protein